MFLVLFKLFILCLETVWDLGQVCGRHLWEELGEMSEARGGVLSL